MFERTPRFCLLFVRVLLLATAVAILPGNATAQQTPSSTSAEDLKALLQRLQDLEGQVTALKVQVKDLSEKAPGTVELPAAEPAQESEGAQAMSMPGHGAETVNSPRFQLHGYGDVGWNTSDLKGSTNSFALGQFNLFITSRLTDKATFLSETVIEADHGTNDFGIDLERMELIYAVNDRLNLQFGRFHTDIGYYNTAYHHSALMQTALGRPFLFAFEDGGGILPVHTVGVSAIGTVSNKLGLHYIAEIGNGRNPRDGVNPVQNVTDDNNGKAFNLGFFVRPDRVPGLQFGFTNYHDHVTPPGRPNVTEDILSAHAVYLNSRFEFLNEAVLLRHSPEGSAAINTPGFYSQISRRFGNYRPYFRYEYVNVPGKDPLFPDVGLLHGPKAGLRYDLNEFAALKIEYGRTMRRVLGPVNSLGTQLSFAF
ncbi:MAG TPA: hypothetical protein VH724_05200 [Candidatus Angelobacter sp.]|nr:hypothetical protein [Candidatus Angelobacter sp.]